MAAFTTIATGIGLALGAGGLAIQVKGQQEQAQAQQKAEKARKQQMALDAARRRRETIREAIAARSLALSNATAQGAGEGSGIQGGFAGIAAQAGRNILDTNQNVELGTKIFNANMDAASGQSLAAFGGGVRDLGGTILDNNVNLAKLKDGVGGLFS